MVPSLTAPRPVGSASRPSNTRPSPPLPRASHGLSLCLSSLPSFTTRRDTSQPAPDPIQTAEDTPSISMSTEEGKTSHHDVAVDEAAHRDSGTNPPEYVDRPKGWMYKSVRVFGSDVWYASPKVQLLMISLVCFLCPGMFNALSGLGGGGQVDPTAQDHAGVALYSTFAVVGFFAGTFANRLGLRLTLSLGGLGYCVYAASFLSYSHTENIGFVIFAGAFLGVCAGLLWTAQGAIMMSYPPEDSKGRYISWFWIIFNLGAVIGSLVSRAPVPS